MPARFTNEYMRAVQKTFNNKKLKETLKKVRDKHEWTKEVPDEELLALKTTLHSIHQGGVQGHGAMLEDEVEKFLKSNAVEFEKQVTIDKNGIIVPRDFTTSEKKKRREQGYHIIDFVIVDPYKKNKIEIGEHISKYIVTSCKTTCRERWTQDNWTLDITPRMYLLLTLSDDYPTKERFRESPMRKIVTMTPKKKDDRVYKLEFEDLYNELRIIGE